MTREEWRALLLAAVAAYHAGDGYALNLYAQRLADQDAEQMKATHQGESED